eukprot:1160172-Pelagomonas_calceolata.AAC.5
MPSTAFAIQFGAIFRCAKRLLRQYSRRSSTQSSRRCTSSCLSGGQAVHIAFPSALLGKDVCTGCVHCGAGSA